MRSKTTFVNIWLTSGYRPLWFFSCSGYRRNAAPVCEDDPLLLLSSQCATLIFFLMTTCSPTPPSSSSSTESIVRFTESPSFMRPVSALGSLAMFWQSFLPLQTLFLFSQGSVVGESFTQCFAHFSSFAFSWLPVYPGESFVCSPDTQPPHGSLLTVMLFIHSGSVSSQFSSFYPWTLARIFLPT